MEEKICCFTGHRKISNSDFETVRKQTTDAIKSLMEKEVYTFICGGAMGFDMLAALIITQLKESNSKLKLILFLPHKDQDKFYDNKNKIWYEHIKLNADKIIYTSSDYYSGCLQYRNRCMVDNSGFLIAYCTKNYGGSFYTKTYAEENGVTVIKITGSND